MALQEYTLVSGDKISDKTADDGTKTTAVTMAGDVASSTDSDIAEAAAKAKNHINSAEITVTYDEDTMEIKAIAYELTKN